MSDPDSSSEDSDLGSGSDIEVVRALRARGETNECVKKFLVARRRLRNKANQRAADSAAYKSHHTLCNVCRLIDIHSLRNGGYILEYSFEGLRASAAACRICNLLLTALRRKHANIDDNLIRGSSIELKVDYHGGVSDYTPTFREIDPKKHLDEIFRLSMGPEADGQLHLDAFIRDRGDGEKGKGKGKGKSKAPNHEAVEAKSRTYLHIQCTMMVCDYP
jgi:hypothetical protein